MIEPSAAGPGEIVDGAAHRAGLAPAYNQYQPTGGDALYHPEHEDALMLMRGLFMTSFLADDFLADQGLRRAGGADLERLEQDVDRARLPGFHAPVARARSA